MPERRKEQQRSVDTKAALLEAALSAFASFGYDGASTRWIAEQVGVNHNLIRHHFGNKEDLWKAVARHALSLFNERVRKTQAAQPDIDSRTAIHLLLREFILFQAAMPDFNRFMVQANQGEPERMQWLVYEFSKIGQRIHPSTFITARTNVTIDAEAAAHLRYIFIGAATSIFTYAQTFSAASGADPFDPAVIERHITIVTELFERYQNEQN